MAEFTHSTPNLTKREDQIDNSAVRKSIRPAGQVFASSLKGQDVVRWVLLGSAATIMVLPGGWIGVLPVTAGYYMWATGSRFRLPFRGPATWGGEDYSEPKPGRPNEYSKSDGILYLGTDQASKEELWITNSDARRHGFILGTTGSGKAFPLDTLVLTRRGWIVIDDLKENDKILHPDGSEVSVKSIHKQGKIETVRMWFDDGRTIECSPDHLWTVDVVSPTPDIKSERRTMLARDIGIMINAYNGIDLPRIDLRLPEMTAPAFDLEMADDMTGAARIAAARGFDAIDFRPSTRGTADQRRAFLTEWARNALPSLAFSADADLGAWKVSGLRQSDARELKRIIWSLGGRATSWRPAETGGRKSLARRLAQSAGKEVRRISGREDRKVSVTFSFEGMDAVFGKDLPYDRDHKPVRIMGMDVLDKKQEMVCIKTDREDGLYVVDGFLVTHNTELLLGIVSQSIMWSSGFLFIDGKGTAPFYMRIWGLARRFGREDDLRVMNFTDSGAGVDPVPGGPGLQSNTSNPFAKGDADQLMNILVSIMGDAGKGNDMWAQRATSLVTAAMKVLVEMRDRGEITFNVQVLREYLALGKGVSEHLVSAGAPAQKGGGFGLGGMGGGAQKAAPATIESITEEAWAELRTRPGMIELYMRALKGDFSDAATMALAGFFTSLPGFNIDLGIKGKPQADKANEQYNFLFMQLTKPLSTFADSFPHIFMTSFGEVDLEDVMLNRRILIVLLPALQKAKTEMQNCGKVVVALVKIMMGKAAGANLSGSKKDNLDSSPTKSTSPFIVVLDEVGYYMVDGIDVMMAQARGLGFMVILAGQDMAAMQAVSKELSEIAAANASLFASGKCVDGGRTIEFIDKLFGKIKVSSWRNLEKMSTALGTRLVNSNDVTFEEIAAVSFKELNGLQPGEFYYKFDKEIARTNTLYIGEDYPEVFSVNKFLRIMGPMDKMPGVDQEEDMRFFGQFSDFCRRFIGDEVRAVAPADDVLSRGVEICDKIMSGLPEKVRKHPQSRLKAMAAGILSAGSMIGDIDDPEEDDREFGLDDEDDVTDYEGAVRSARLRSDSRSRGKGMIDLLIAERDAARKAGMALPRPAPEDTVLSAIDRIAMSQEAFKVLMTANDGVDHDAIDAIREVGLTGSVVTPDTIMNRGAAAMGALEALANKRGK